ncbi:hypothetical protein SEA_WEASELS2_234 [Rhodococcus phage Weasels2]|uniref:Uncharacterized protein n=1 Tax=Rhodococcus phage Weasels2 TaxID=1897437 RepID=A0A1I9SAK6_9CAUD|nr:hypothetical protein FDH04_gp182 [Rhodococcus phage Weasels2]AOZ63812.1 hypothetical protein SEA_WEASELS2_234 [Rhodococcus phage Weasels2]
MKYGDHLDYLHWLSDESYITKMVKECEDLRDETIAIRDKTIIKAHFQFKQRWWHCLVPRSRKMDLVAKNDKGEIIHRMTEVVSAKDRQAFKNSCAIRLYGHDYTIEEEH